MTKWQIGSNVICVHLNHSWMCIAGHPNGLKRTDSGWTVWAWSQMRSVVSWWIQREKFQKSCAVEGCGETAYTSITIATYDIAREHLELVQSADRDTRPLVLCNPHYQQLYRAIKSPVPCATYASQPWDGGDYTRRCRNLIQITTYSRRWISMASLQLTGKFANSVMTSIGGYCNSRMLVNQHLFLLCMTSNISWREKSCNLS